MNLGIDSIAAVLFLLGAGQGAFLAVALLAARGGPRRANRYLACYLLAFVVTLTDYALDAAAITEQVAQLRTLLWPKEFFYGVFVYFYVRELTLPGRYPLRERQWLHLAPAFLHVAITWSLLPAPAATQTRVLDGAEPTSSAEWIYTLLLGQLELPLGIAHVSLYLALSIRLLRRHELRVKANFSYTEKVGLRWLRRLLTGTVAVYAIWVGGSLLNIYWPVQEAVFVMLGIAMVLLIYAMGYLGLRQPLIFTAPEYAPPQAATAIPAPSRPTRPREASPPPEGDRAMPTSDEIDPPANAGETLEAGIGKYRNSALSEEIATALLAEATRAMEENKLYLDSTLSLPQLADRLGVSVNHLSQAINQAGGRNFFEFVNGFRVRAVIDRIDDESTILDLAMNAGFNSKSAFYTAFRKHTGVTPGQYRKHRQRAAA